MTDTINILCTNATVHGRYFDINSFLLFWLYMYCDSYSIWIEEGISLVHMLHNNIFWGIFIYKITLCNDRHVEWYKNVKYWLFIDIYQNFNKFSPIVTFMFRPYFPIDLKHHMNQKVFLLPKKENFGACRSLHLIQWIP